MRNVPTVLLKNDGAYFLEEADAHCKQSTAEIFRTSIFSRLGQVLIRTSIVPCRYSFERGFNWCASSNCFLKMAKASPNVNLPRSAASVISTRLCSCLRKSPKRNLATESVSAFNDFQINLPLKRALA
ncbi:MAG: hypothetical protein ACREC8_03055 [Limisphaerales bacterium]